MRVRTRFAPSPTGMLHVGGARTALFNWAFARHHGGEFVLRIEDTDRERSSTEAVEGILRALEWLGLDYDEGPIFQSERLAHYQEVAERLLAEGKAYHCYATPEELEAMRTEQRSRGEKPKYDGRWRPEPGRTLPPPPPGVTPVVRFRMPRTGRVGWRDLVKGEIAFENEELDDFVLLRADGTPTYNFCAVVDDWEMGITHVIRGDDHVNNTPKQIHLYQALGAEVPQFAHLSMILGPDGQKLSKRHGAVSVMQYYEDGYLPEAMVNYLARLGWSHGDEELFDRAQLVAWFSLEAITPSAARFDFEKLRWVNGCYLRAKEPESLVTEVKHRLAKRGVSVWGEERIVAAVALYQPRVATLEELADALVPLFRFGEPPPALAEKYLRTEDRQVLAEVQTRLAAIAAEEWTADQVGRALREVMRALGVKMAQVGVPLRVALLGVSQSPDIETVVAVLGREETLSRLQRVVG
ncbi:MAG: glutamate--tRNA ligase [Hydrogenophilus sp.]|nr:glutamate--tRNA ligase [Hydrogenophilus sp.]